MTEKIKRVIINSISKEAIISFNKGKTVTFNESYNKHYKLGSLKERGFLQCVNDFHYGIFKERITERHIMEYLDSCTAEEIEQHRKRLEE